MKVLFVASECAPFVKTGGLADVVSSLPKALRAKNVDVRIMLPGYSAVLDAIERRNVVWRTDDLVGEPAELIAGKADGQSLYAVAAPAYFDRKGNPYMGPDGSDWPDNWQRFGALCRMATDLSLGQLGGWRPDIVHVHDWQAGLVPVLLAGEAGPATIATIHNIAFQGVFAPEDVAPLDLPPDGFTLTGYEYHGGVSFLKAALSFADRITTVSPTYAGEIMTPEFGFGLEGVLQHRRADVSGILNGIDLDVWDPAADRAIALPYSARRVVGKAKNKRALEDRFGLPHAPDDPLFCVVSRLSEQKGIDLLVSALPRLIAAGGRLVVLGSGDATLEKVLRQTASAAPTKIAVEIGYDEDLSHLMQAGADAILIPSRFEPCGLTQLYGLRYGTLPIVARTGGLADTVIDLNEAALAAECGNGFQFSPVTAEAFGDAIERAVAFYRDKSAWRATMRRAMKQPVGWDISAQKYIDLYRSLVDPS